MPFIVNAEYLSKHIILLCSSSKTVIDDSKVIKIKPDFFENFERTKAVIAKYLLTHKPVGSITKLYYKED